LEDFDIAVPGSPEAIWNTQMSSVRKSVEWGFAYINKNWAFLNFQSALKLFKSPIAKYYIIATFLSNLRTCYNKKNFEPIIQVLDFMNKLFSSNFQVPGPGALVGAVWNLNKL
jgi:hypothetical protein